MKPLICIACALAVAIGASSTESAAQSPPVPNPAVGWYATTVSEWTPPLRGDSAIYSPPPRIRLHPSTTTRNSGSLSPDIAGRHVGSMPHTPSWAAAGDTMWLSWSDGFVKTNVRVERRDSIFVGDADATSDFRKIGRRDPQARVVLRRVACDDTTRPDTLAQFPPPRRRGAGTAGIESGANRGSI